MNVERSIFVCAILLLLVLLNRGCVQVAETSKQLTDAIGRENTLKVKHLADSSKIYSMTVTQLKDKEAIEKAESQIAELKLLNLKKPKEVVKIQYREKIVTQVQLEEPITIDSTEYLKLPQTFEKKDKWYSLNGQINTKGTLVIDSLVSFGKFTYAVGDTLRKGFFNRILRKKDQVVRLHIDNPNMSVQGMENLYLNRPPKWYQTGAFKFGVGLATGLGIFLIAK